MQKKKLKQLKIRTRNLQFVGIAVFIPSFFMFVLLLGRRKKSTRVLEFMGLLALLMFFEFITLVVHPLVAEISHHTPVVELLILVVIASVLVPMHHKLTHWMKEWMVKKEKVLEAITSTAPEDEREEEEGVD